MPLLSGFTTFSPTFPAQVRPALGPDIRIGVILPYIVIYSHTETDGIVRVLRIVHGSRRVSGKLLRGAS
jgi:toxin ParE1/3/4